DQCANIEIIENFLRSGYDILRHDCTVTGSNLCHKMTAVRCANNGASERHDPSRVLPIQNHVIARREQSLEPIAESNALPTELVGSEHDTAQHRIQSRAIATAGQNTNPWPHVIKTRSERLGRIDESTPSRPLIVQLPPFIHQSRALSESVSA